MLGLLQFCYGEARNIVWTFSMCAQKCEQIVSVQQGAPPGWTACTAGCRGRCTACPRNSSWAPVPCPRVIVNPALLASPAVNLPCTGECMHTRTCVCTGIHACVWLASSSALFRGSVTCVHHRYPAFLWMSHLLIPPLVTFVWWQLRMLSSCLTFFLFISLRSGKWLCTAQLLWTLPCAINSYLVMSPQPDPK